MSLSMRCAMTLGSLVIVACVGCDAPGINADPIETSANPKLEAKNPPLMRVFVQDMKAATFKWADVRLAEDGTVTLDELAAVEGFPTLDTKRQKLVQMQDSNGLVCVGVRDDADGAFQSGWVLLHSGVTYEDHGDHGHWRFRGKPAVWDSRLDTKQGNPAHLYCYDGQFFLANDKLNGYTRIDPTEYDRRTDRTIKKDTPRFIVGGGNHITLAVVDDKVGYSCWIDGGGPNKGRVDVTPIGSGERSEPTYTFHLPTGVIHGATACSGKVFFAPADGVCWIEADHELKLKPEQVKIHHIDLGKDGDTPRRTGAFVTHGNHVVFTTGKGANSALTILNASEPEPKPVFVKLDVKPGTQAVTPAVVETPGGKPYAFVFHDRLKDSDAQDILEVITLDPNGDGKWSDASATKTMNVGKSAVDGHFGHHDVAFDTEERFAVFTNPGDGTLSVLSLKSLELVGNFPVGGSPSAIVAVGGQESDD